MMEYIITNGGKETQTLGKPEFHVMINEKSHAKRDIFCYAMQNEKEMRK
jgi:hypothetical protein